MLCVWHPTHSAATVKGVKYTEKQYMSKIYLYIAVFICLFVPVFAGASADTDPEATLAEGKAIEVTDVKQALELYCTAARQGLGKSQYEVGRIYAAQPGQQTKHADDIGGQRDLAAAMMWLDMAIINKVKDAKILRRTLGMVAHTEEFLLYGQFTRMEIDAPCTWAEVYEPPEEFKTND